MKIINAFKFQPGHRFHFHTIEMYESLYIEDTHTNTRYQIECSTDEYHEFILADDAAILKLLSQHPEFKHE